jgi:dihydrofolate reductase
MGLSRKCILFVAMSLDGFIASSNDSLDFLKSIEKEGEDYGYKEFMDTIDTVVMGRRTYEKVMTLVPAFPHAHLRSYIITKNPKPTEGNMHFYSGNLSELIYSLKTQQGKDIFIDGGAILANSLFEINAIDEIVVSIVPFLLGDGVSLFQNSLQNKKIELKSCKHYSTGLVQLHYTIPSIS